MQQYSVTGMSCAACSARVEKAVKSVPGVNSCAVSLLTNSMGVEGSAKPGDIISAVEKAGYGAKLKDDENQASAVNSYEDQLADKETPLLKKRLIISVGFLLILMYIGMGHMMLNLPVPGFLEGNCIAIGLSEMLLAVIVMVINQKFFISGFRGLLHKAPNMDTLVALGSGAAFVYSTYALFAMTSAQISGGTEAAMPWMDEFYFESSAMILTLITVGKMLEARSKGKTTDALKGLMRLSPQTANIERDGKEITVPIAEVKTDDVFLVRPGETVPVDGVVTDGSTAINESALTGESIPVSKSEGDEVSAATINQSGFIRCRATRVGKDTTLSQIIKMVSDAAATKAPIAKIADKVSGIFVPTVISIAVVTIIVWLLIGKPIGFALARGISVLVISCPCALGLATPVAIMVGSGVGAKNGVLFKTAVSLENTGRVNIVALDKTGTITKGEPQITDIITYDNYSDDELLKVAASVEKLSEHPLALAITRNAEEKNLSLYTANDFQAVPGKGLKCELSLGTVYAGNLSYVSRTAAIDNSQKAAADKLSGEGKTPLYFALNDKLIGIIAVADVIKEDSVEAINELHKMGVKVVMLTGDNKRTADAIGSQIGVDAVAAELLPNEKEMVIRELQKQGSVAMVGDGINDAPALTRADIGMAVAMGSDIAVDSADVVLMKSRLTDVSSAIRLSRATIRNIHENLFWAFFYNSIGIPLAAGCYYALFGWALNPMFGAAAMSLSSFCVVTNALRLNLLNIHSTKNDKPQKNSIEKLDISWIKEDNQINKTESEENTMKKTMKIEGMMCPHCEMTVKKALEAVDGVESAAVSHEAGEAVVSLSADVADEVLKSAVEAKDYTVTAIL